MSNLKSPSLESRAIQSIFWSTIERLGPQMIQFIVSIVLARLLLPEQFGLVGMLTVFLVLGHAFVNSGFSSALIQKQNVTEVHYNSVFFLNIALSIAVAGILCLTAPWIASFYGAPMLTSLTRALSLNLVISAFSMIQVTLLTKRLDFKTQTKATLLASVASGLVGIGMALLGFGVWSLVAQSLSLTLFNTVLLWVFNTWRPQAILSLTALHELFTFGSRMLASGILETVFANMYTVVIGRFFSPAVLGHYTRAYTLQQLPSETLGRIVGRVTFPVFSELQDDSLRIKYGLRQGLRAVALINFPLMIGLMVCARPLVLTLLTDKWIQAVPYLQMLSIVGLLYPLNPININALLARGHSNIFMRLEVIKKMMIGVVIVLAIIWRWGIEAIILGQIVTSMSTYLLSSHNNRVTLDYGTKAQLQDLWPYLAAAGVMGIVVHALNWMPFGHPVVLLVIQVITGGLVYSILCRSFRLPVFMDAWNVFQGKIVAQRMAR